MSARIGLRRRLLRRGSGRIQAAVIFTEAFVFGGARVPAYGGRILSYNDSTLRGSGDTPPDVSALAWTAALDEAALSLRVLDRGGAGAANASISARVKCFPYPRARYAGIDLARPAQTPRPALCSAHS